MFKIEITAETLDELFKSLDAHYAAIRILGKVPVPDGTPAETVAAQPEAKKSGSKAPAKAKAKAAPAKAGTKKAGTRQLPAAQTEAKANGKGQPEVPTDSDLNNMARGYAVKHGFEIVRGYLTELGAERITEMTDDQKRKFHTMLSGEPK